MCNNTVDNPELERDFASTLTDQGFTAEAHGDCVHAVVTVKRAGTSVEEIEARAGLDGFEVFGVDHEEVTLTGRKDALREEWGVSA